MTKEKTKTKPTKKKSRKVRSRPEPAVILAPGDQWTETQRLLMVKIRSIAKEVREFEADVPVCDPITGEELFNYTNAQKVFDVYRKQCEKHHLTIVPDASWPPVITSDRGLVTVAMPYLVTDLETGATFRTMGIGSGANQDWAANTANTRCRKQMLLTLFDALWSDPEEMRRDRAEQNLSESLGFDVRRISDAKLFGDLMREFFAQTRAKFAIASQQAEKKK